MVKLNEKPELFCTPLDKLAQLSGQGRQPRSKDVAGQPVVTTVTKLRKRARAKYFTSVYLPALIALDSPLKKSYINSAYCADQLVQKADKITSKYCNNRWCLVCNRIRTAKAINSYKPQLQQFNDARFLTLTVKAVPASELSATIDLMVKQWRLLYQGLKAQGIELLGVRKLECNYNPKMNTFNPHFHLIVEGRGVANTIKEDWLRRFPTSNIRAQDERKTKEGALVELFKYFTKIVTKGKIYAPAMDVIFQAMAGRRVFQPFGIRKASEEVEELQAEVIEVIEGMEITGEEVFWEWWGEDWHNSFTGVALTGHEPSEEMRDLPDCVVWN